MMHIATPKNSILIVIALGVSILSGQRAVQADPSKYPQFAQQSLPDGMTPVFINVQELVEAVKAGTKPLILDVRTDEEFKEAHILGAVSAPLAEFKEYLISIPRDRLVVLY